MMKFWTNVFAALVLLTAPVCAQEVTETTAAVSDATTAPTPYAGLSLQFLINDSSGNGNGLFEPGENVVLGVSVANFDETDFPASILTIAYEGLEFEANQVELPFLSPGEGIEFDVGAWIAADASTDAVAISAYFETVETRDELRVINYTMLGGKIVSEDEIKTFSFGTQGTDGTVVTDTTDAGPQVGRVMGEILDLGIGEPLMDGLIVLTKQAPADSTDPIVQATATTDEMGRFATDVEPGLWDLVIQKNGTEIGSESNVEVKANLANRLELFVGQEEDEEVLEFVVTSNAEKAKASIQLVIRKKSAIVTDNISAEEMSKTGASDAGDAVKTSVGISIIDGKYVYVRGLGERYTYSTLNGIKLPSPEPDKKVVPLDIFPTSILVGVSVAKTASPDLPGDFAGGAVRIETKRFPEENECKTGFGTGVNSISTGQDIYGYNGGPWDWTGFADGDRAFPSSLPQNDEKLQAGDYYSDEDLVAAAREFDNDFGLTTIKGLPKIKASLSCGGTKINGQKELGYLAYGSYSYKNANEEIVRARPRVNGNVFASAAGQNATQLAGEEGASVASLHVFGNVTRKINTANILNITTLFTNEAEEKFRLLEGAEQNQNGQIRATRNRLQRRQLWFNKLGGEHFLTNLDIDWYVSGNLARREDPDQRTVVYTQDSGGEYLFADKGQAGEHFWSELLEPGFASAANFNVPFTPWGNLDASFKTGIAASIRRRSFEVRRLPFRLLGSPSEATKTETQALPPEELLTDDQIGVNIRLQETTRNNDSYTAGQDVVAGYAMIDLPLAEKFKILTGVRYEYSDLFVQTFDQFNAGNAQREERINHNALPSLNLVYNLNETQNLRAAFSQTVARPDFHEMSSFCQPSFFGGPERCGNKAIEQSQIYNVDLRWEWFPNEGEVIAVSTFYKKFIDPIEEVLLTRAQISYQNAVAAQAYGVEIEGRKALTELDSKAKALYFGGNITLMDSQIELDTTRIVPTNPERRMQGQSPVVFNGFFGWDDGRTSSQLTYNVASKRISTAGINGLPDAFDNPFHDLVWTFDHEINEAWSISAGVDNLLNETLEETMEITSGGNTEVRIIESSYKGVSADIGFSYKF